MMVSVSANGGASFGAPNQLSPAGNNGTGNGRQGSSSDVAADGTVYIAFEQGPSQVIVTSRDGGKSWTRPVTIAAVADINDPIPGANFRTDSFPSLAADPRTGSTTVYVAWANRTAAGGRIVVATSTDRGAQLEHSRAGQRQRRVCVLPGTRCRARRPSRSRVPGPRRSEPVHRRHRQREDRRLRSPQADRLARGPPP